MDAATADSTCRQCVPQVVGSFFSAMPECKVVQMVKLKLSHDELVQ